MLLRAVRDSDLEECLALEPAHLGAELVGVQRAKAAWRRLLHEPAFNAAMIEDDAADGDRVLAFGAAVFVPAAFADAELADPQPGMIARLIAGVVEGQPVVLTAEELRHSNANDGLDLVCLAGVYRSDLNREMAIVILNMLSASFIAAYRGYRNRRILSEAIGETEIINFVASGIWRCVKSFGDRARFVMTRKEAFAMPVSNAIDLFRDAHPVLRLREQDQRLLESALNGLTDEELAQALKVHVGTVKKRWLEIYNRMSAASPTILPQYRIVHDDHTRGKQKRHRALAYVREHPEELRPYEYKDLAAR
jgi:hypothetical protein